MLRETIHRVEGQLKDESVVMPLSSILAEAVFCWSALLSINGASPYNAVHGRVLQFRLVLSEPEAFNGGLAVSLLLKDARMNGRRTTAT